MKALITGITGFAGSHLAEFLLKEGFDVYGAARWRSRTENIEGIKEKITLFECDINDAFSVKQLLENVRPDRIYHLAGQSSVAVSWNSPAETFSTNVIGQINILEAVRSLKIDPLVQIAGSSEEYGYVKDDEMPITETNELRPLSPYAVSKVSQDLMGYQYFKSYGLKIVRTRAFNHTGPRHAEIFVASDFAKQIALIDKGIQKPVIRTGNLDASRDYSDVRDVVRGYFMALEKGNPGEVYNICSEKMIKISRMLEILLSFSKSDIKIEKDPSRFRPADIPRIFGSCEKMKEETGWRVEIPIERTLEDLLDHWRQRV